MCFCFIWDWNVKSLPSQESLLRHNGNYLSCQPHLKHHLFPLQLPSLCLFLLSFPSLSVSFLAPFFFLSHPHTRSQAQRCPFFLMKKKLNRGGMQFFFQLRDAVSQIHCHSFCFGIWTSENCEILSPRTISVNICYCVHVCESAIVLVCLHVWKKTLQMMSIAIETGNTVLYSVMLTLEMKTWI